MTSVCVVGGRQKRRICSDFEALSRAGGPARQQATLIFLTADRRGFSTWPTPSVATLRNL